MNKTTAPTHIQPSKLGIVRDNPKTKISIRKHTTVEKSSRSPTMKAFSYFMAKKIQTWVRQIKVLLLFPMKEAA